MSVTITLNIYSGRPNPSWELTHLEIIELEKRLRAVVRTSVAKVHLLRPSLGYRGLIIYANREKYLDAAMLIYGGYIDRGMFSNTLIDEDSTIERWLLETANKRLADKPRNFALENLPHAKLKVELQFLAGPPPYDPGRWNSDDTIRSNNNCYNYGCDTITNTFAQPGRGSGAVFTMLNCTDLTAAAQRDGLISVPSGSVTPAQGHIAALVYGDSANFHDFHWYRLDDNTDWSHKPGADPVINVDAVGALITDPSTCDRGAYTTFCGYFNVVPGSISIS